VRTGRSAARGRAKNVIFMVADGMSAGTLSLAELACRTQRNEHSAWVRLWSRTDVGGGAGRASAGVRRAMMTTHAADGPVTDSAAAGSAWSIGRKVNNDVINITPAGAEHEPLLVTARNAGKATGLVTTTRVTHATPASFIANVPSRDMEQVIAGQTLERRVDVVLGGGARYFTDQLLATRPDLRVVRTADELRAAPAEGPLLGLFTRDHMSFEIDRAHPEPGAASTEPDLAAMTTAALDRLLRAGDGFVLQIEGGRVDHAAHYNDAVALVHDQLAFDRAIDAVVKAVGGRDDTLAIITTDHANANPGLTYYGQKGAQGFDLLLKGRASYDRVLAGLSGREGGTPAERAQTASDRVRDLLGIEFTDRDRADLAGAFAGRPSPFDPGYEITSTLGRLLGARTGVFFVSPNHTADLVELTAFGPGSEEIAPLVDNTALHGLMLRAMGVEVAGR
jgi:alkaline phosphatase